MCSGEDSGEDATLRPPTVEPEKCTRRGGNTSAVGGMLLVGVPVGVVTDGTGGDEVGAGELVGVLAEAIEV